MTNRTSSIRKSVEGSDFYGGELDEVFISNEPTNDTSDPSHTWEGYISLKKLYPDSEGGETGSETGWDYGGGGDGSSNTSSEEANAFGAHFKIGTMFIMRNLLVP